MVKEELIKRSPLRILEKSTHGGLGVGNIGIIAAPKGVGKTACLVHMATDQLFQDKHVIHISFSIESSHILSWYEDIFAEVARRYKLDCAMEVHDHIIRNRVIMNFRQDDLPVQRIERSIELFEQNGKFHADTIVVDGYDFSRASVDDVRELKSFIKRNGAEMWMSATTGSHTGTTAEVPAELTRFAGEFAVVVCLETRDDHIRLRLVKDHEAVPAPDTHLQLDPKILLISAE